MIRNQIIGTGTNITIDDQLRKDLLHKVTNIVGDITVPIQRIIHRELANAFQNNWLWS